MQPNRDSVEQPAVVTTIVGGRPPGAGQPVGPIPRGIEVLVKKAAVDAEFRTLLLEKRAQAAGEIGLSLDPAESVMLAAVPAGQLEAIIARTIVPEEHRRTFLGKAAAAMLAALTMATGVGVAGAQAVSRGISPSPAPGGGTFGNSPDRPPAKPSTTSESSVERRVVQLIAKRTKLPTDKIKRDATLVKDLGVKASQLSNIRKDIEKEFGIALPQKNFRKLQTVGDLIDYASQAIGPRRDTKPVPQPLGGSRPDRPGSSK